MTAGVLIISLGINYLLKLYRNPIPFGATNRLLLYETGKNVDI